MSSQTKRRLKIYLPIAISLLIIVAVIVIILLSNKITAKDYFNAVNTPNYSKQLQTTTITENDVLIYEKIETIIFDGDNVYHQIKEKTVSADINKDFDETTTEFYYSKDKMYYFENNVWNVEDFTLSEKLKTYDLKTEYFETLEFNKKIETEGCLKGKLKDGSVAKVFSGLDYTNANLVIIVNKDLKVQKFNINAKTSSNRDVKIENVYTYSNENVVLPIQ